jgi:hypothetical protein
MYLQVTKWFANLFFIFALFPYVSFGTNSMDTQPHFVIFGMLSIFLFVTSGGVFKRITHFIFFISIILLVLLFKAQDFDFSFYRAAASYLAFFVVVSASYIYIKRYGIPIRLMVAGNIAYICAALLQFFYNQHLLSFLVTPNSFIDPSRGVSSLTPEPTFFAITLFFWSWIYLIIYDYRPNKFIIYLLFINLLTIILLSKSTMVIVFLLITTLFYLLKNIKKKKILFLIFLSIVLVFISLFSILTLYPESRFSQLTNIFMILDGNIIEKLIVIINFDASINDRILNALFPYFGFFYNYGMPGGIDSFYDTSVYLSNKSGGYFWAGLGSNKILSFIGTFIYELGFISLFLFYYFYDFLKDHNNQNRIFEIILLFILLNSAIPVGFPLIGIMIALMYHKKNNNNYAN